MVLLCFVHLLIHNFKQNERPSQHGQKAGKAAIWAAQQREGSKIEEGGQQRLTISIAANALRWILHFGKHSAGKVEVQRRAGGLPRHAVEVILHSTLRRIGGAVRHTMQILELSIHLRQILQRHRLPEKQALVA